MMLEPNKSRIIQASNLSLSATQEQIITLFGFLGHIEDYKLFKYIQKAPDEPTETDERQVCYVKYKDPASAQIAQHLTNTAFLDKALNIAIYLKEAMPENLDTSLVCDSSTSLLIPSATWPVHVVHQISGSGPSQLIHTIDPTLTTLGLPQYPPLTGIMESSRVEEIRKTIYVGNLNSKVSGEALLNFFNSTVGEVSYVRMAGDDSQPTRFAFVEFSRQESIPIALQNNGVMLADKPLKINHANNAIVKPNAKPLEVVQKEIERALHKVKEVESLISASLEEKEKERKREKEREDRDRERKREKEREREARALERRAQRKKQEEEREREKSLRKKRQHKSRTRSQTPSRSRKERRRHHDDENDRRDSTRRRIRHRDKSGSSDRERHSKHHHHTTSSKHHHNKSKRERSHHKSVQDEPRKKRSSTPHVTSTNANITATLSRSDSFNPSTTTRTERKEPTKTSTKQGDSAIDETKTSKSKNKKEEKRSRRSREKLSSVESRTPSPVLLSPSIIAKKVAKQQNRDSMDGEMKYKYSSGENKKSESPYPDEYIVSMPPPTVQNNSISSRKEVRKSNPESLNETLMQKLEQLEKEMGL